ncbi:HAD family phosphatase [Myxococcota bacterium]|nr:HAD family phosphatase [Myxococcota bacterium]
MTTRVVLFDLGGVLVELVGMPTLRRWAGEADDEALWARWLTSPWVRRFECGGCSPEAFAMGMVEEWTLPVGPEEYLEVFRGWPRRLLPGARDLVEQVSAAGWRTGCLSNSNELHWPLKRDGMELGRLLDAHFVSHELGCVKPDPEIYQEVIAQLGVPAETVLFLDDNQINVDGARAVGMEAFRARGVEEAREVLEARGILV